MDPKRVGAKKSPCYCVRRPFVLTRGLWARRRLLLSGLLTSCFLTQVIVGYSRLQHGNIKIAMKQLGQSPKTCSRPTRTGRRRFPSCTVKALPLDRSAHQAGHGSSQLRSYGDSRPFVRRCAPFCTRIPAGRRSRSILKSPLSYPVVQ